MRSIGWIITGSLVVFLSAGEAFQEHPYPRLETTPAVAISDTGDTAHSGTFGFGRPATDEDIAAWDIDVMADGTGLPPGNGTVTHGAEIYAVKCSACHGPDGEGGAEIGLVGRQPNDAFPFAEDQTAPRRIGSYWPYAPTLFDYIRRSMPFDRPGSMTDDEVYSVTAFLLYQNDLISEDAVMNAETLPAVDMPARDRFVPDDRLNYQVVR